MKILPFLLLFSFPLYAEDLQGYKEGQKFTFKAKKLKVKARGKPVYLEEEASDAFNDLMAYAAEEGYYIALNYGFRTYSEQKFWYRLYKAKCKKDETYCGMAAKPGHSTHQEGLSVDIRGCVRYFTQKDLSKMPRKNKERVEKRCKKVGDSYMCRTVLYWWLKNNASEYGFYNDVPEEPWHWTYLGKEIDVGG